MINFRLTLTERKPYSQYVKKITYQSLIFSSILICLYIIFIGFHIVEIVGIFLFAFAGVLRFYINKVYFIEPFFMIQNDFIKYRFNEFGGIVNIKACDISLITIKNSSIEFLNLKGKIKKVKLGIIPEEYTRVIKYQLLKFAKERVIALALG